MTPAKEDRPDQSPGRVDHNCRRGSSRLCREYSSAHYEPRFELAAEDSSAAGGGNVEVEGQGWGAEKRVRRRARGVSFREPWRTTGQRRNAFTAMYYQRDTRPACDPRGAANRPNKKHPQTCGPQSERLGGRTTDLKNQGA